MKEVVDATAPIADAAVREAWPYKKVLLAVLPPTLALLSVVIGVWDNGNRDRAAQAEAEKDRAAAANEAEQARVAEVAKDQAAAEQERGLREAALVLPRYEDLFAKVHATMDVVDPCLDELNRYLEKREVRAVISGAIDSPDPPTIPSIAPIDSSDQIPYAVDAAVVNACSKVEATFDPLELSLDTALLVSNPTLESAATDLVEQLQSSSETAQVLLDKVLPDPLSATGYSIMVGGEGWGYLADGTPLELFVWQLNNGLSAIRPASENVIDSTRGVVLELGQ